MIKKLSLYASVMLFSANTSVGQVVINEFLAANKSSISDPQYGAKADWIELYNTGAGAADLTGYTLSDNSLDPAAWTLPANTAIPAGGYLILWADGKNTGLHTNFKLGASGESLMLSHPDATVADSYTFGIQTDDISMGRMPNGKGDFVYYTVPTPGAANGAGGLLGTAPEPIFSVVSGFYPTTKTVALSTTLASSTIRYTTDGSEPTASSTAYSAPISIAKTTVLRARVFNPQYAPGRIVCSSYFIDERTFDLPVVSLAVDPVKFFDSKVGMYVMGPNAESAEPHFGANFWEDREEPVSFEYYDKAGVHQVQVNAGVKIFGGWSRANDQRSLAISCKESEYGDDRINYKFFDEKNITSFKSIVLRNAGNDNPYGMMRDAAMETIIIGKLNVDYLGYRPCVTFINGKYWGILNIREKINEHFVEGNAGIPKKDVELLSSYMEVMSGDSLHYRAMLDFATKNDLSVQANYKYMETQMDMDSYIDYLITEIFFANADWPDNNIKYYRKSGYGGRWRWVVFDLDFGLGIWGSTSSANAVKQAFGDGIMSTRTWAMQDWGSILNENLILNDEFKNKLIQRFAYHLENTFESTRTTGIIDNVANGIKNEIPYHKTRWNQSTYSWDVSDMKSWAKARPAAVAGHLKDYFSLGSKYSLSVSGSTGLGGLIVSGMKVSGTTFSQSVYGGVPVYLEAIPKPGYSFSHWENAAGVAVGTRLQYSVTLSANTSVKAVFTERPLVTNIYINEVLPSNTSIITDENGQYEDVIELYNAGNAPVNLGGLYLSDKAGTLKQWMIPNNNPELTTIPAKGFLTIFADEDSLHGALHANFKLSAQKDTVILSQATADGKQTILDQITFANVIVDVSYGHFPDGTGALDAFITPTPGASNVKNNDALIAGVSINEFEASNHNTAMSPSGEFSDWVELYNSTSAAINVGGLYLTDDLENPFKARIPITSPLLTTIPPKGYLLIWADGKTSANAVHVDFGISASGGYLALNQKTAQGANRVCELLYPQQIADISYGLIPNGGSSYKKLLKPTPGTANVDVAYRAVTDLVVNEVLANNTKTKADETGTYSPWIELHYAGATIVNIAGLYLTDNLADPFKYTITRLAADKTTLSSGDKLCLWADSAKAKGLTHLNFKLSSTGGTLYLYQYDGTKAVEVGSYTYINAGADLSHGRYPDGTENLEAMPPSYSAANVSTMSIAYLSNITADNGTFLPAFKQETLSYTVTLAPGTTTVPVITAKPYSAGQTVSIVQAATLADVATVTAVSEDKKNTLVYSVAFTVTQSSDADLKSLTLSKGELSPVFSPDVTSYTASFLGDNIAPQVSAEANYAGAQVAISQSQLIPGTAMVSVTAEDGTKKIYTINYSTGPVVVEGFVDDFNDNYNNGWNDANKYYTFSEANGQLTVKLATSTDGYRSFKFNFPLKIVDMTNYPYVSMKMKVPATSTEVRIDLRDSKKYVTNTNEQKVVVKNTADFVEYYFDYTGRFYQSFPADKQGPVDYDEITDLVMILQPGVTGAVNRTVVFEDVKIGKPAYKPEYDSRLSDLTVAGYTLFPTFSPSTKDYTVIIPDNVTSVPVVTATAAHAKATVSYTNAALIPGTTRVKVTAEAGGGYQYYNVNFAHKPALGCAGGEIFKTIKGTITDGSGASAYIKNADCYWLIQPRLADTITLSFTALETQLNFDKVEIYDGESSKSPLLGTVSGTSLKSFKATSGAMLIRFVTDDYTELAGWSADYTTVTKKSSDAGILGLTIKNGTLGQEFSAVDKTFIVSATDKSVVPSIVPQLSDAIGATYSLENAASVPGVSLLTVTAEDGTKKIYTFYIIDKQDLISSLPAISYLQYTSAPNIVLQPYLNAVVPVSWSVKNSSNISVFVQDGVVSFVSEPEFTGTETVYISASYGTISETESISVTVKEKVVPIETISIPSTVLLEYPSIYTYTPTLQPANCTEKTVKWHSSNPAVVTVNALGQIAAVTNGTATITAYNADSTVFGKSVVTTTVCKEPVSITLKKNAVELRLDEAVQLEAALLPLCLSNKELQWTSSNTAVATVSASGVIITASIGQTVISVKPKADLSVSARCTVTVTEPCLAEAATITAETKSIELVQGLTAKIATVISPANVCDTIRLYKSSNDLVATVNKGTVTAVAAGMANITITNSNINSTVATIAVNVLPREISVESVALSHSSLELVAGSSFLLSADVQPVGATVKDVVWNTSNAKATVTNGLVGAIDTGKVVISVKTADGGYSDVCNLTILPLKATKMTISSRSPQVRVGQTLALSISFIPENPTIKKINWISRNSQIFSIGANGLITGINPGSAYVVGKLMDSGTISDSVLITVLPLQIDSVNLSTSSINLSVGKTREILATVYPLGESQAKAQFSVSNKSVISVSATGIVSGLTKGEAYLYAQAGGKKDSCLIVVNEIFAESISIQSSISLAVGDNAILTASFVPQNTTVQTVTWVSDFTSVAQVDKDGNVTAIGQGVAVISATSSNGKTAQCEVSVSKDIISIDTLTIATIPNINVGETYKLALTIVPQDATSTSIIWQSSNTAVVEVKSGILTAIATGTATISVTIDGKTTFQTVTVVKSVVTKITFTEYTASLNAGSVALASVEILPESATNKNIVWSVSNSSVLKVENGKYTALATGDSYLYAASEETGIKDSVLISVKGIEVQSVSIGYESKTVLTGNDLQLTATVNPSSATDKAVLWETSDAEIFTIDAAGLLHAVAAGQAWIRLFNTARTLVDSVQFTCQKRVISLDSVGISVPETSINIGQTFNAQAIPYPAGASNASFIFSSSNPAILSVSQTGAVVGRTAGLASVEVKSADGTVSNEVIIRVASKPTEQLVMPASLLLVEGESSSALYDEITIIPADAGAQKNDIIWVAEPAGIVTIKGSVITANKTGVATIKATSGDLLITAVATVTVVANTKPTIKAIPEQFALTGKSFAPIYLTEYVTDDYTAAEKIKWSVLPQTNLVVTIDENYIAWVTAKDASWTGIERITLIAVDAQGKSSYIGAYFTVMSRVSEASQSADVHISLAPNPATQFVDVSSAGVIDPVIEIVTAAGETVIVCRTAGDTHRIDISALPAGLYSVRVSGANANFSEKLTKQ